MKYSVTTEQSLFVEVALLIIVLASVVGGGGGDGGFADFANFNTQPPAPAAQPSAPTATQAFPISTGNNFGTFCYYSNETNAVKKERYFITQDLYNIQMFNLFQV